MVMMLIAMMLMMTMMKNSVDGKDDCDDDDGDDDDDDYHFVEFVIATVISFFSIRISAVFFVLWVPNFYNYLCTLLSSLPETSPDHRLRYLPV